MSFLKRKHQFPKVPTTSVIALVPQGYDNQLTLYFAVHVWKNHISANHIQHMLYYIVQGKKFPTEYYFSPYTLNNFFTFLAKMIDKNTVIPKTHGKQFVGSNAKVIFYENVWEMHNNQLVTVKGQPCVVDRNVEAHFPNVPLTDKYQHITVWANYLLFCSYTNSQIDSFRDLKGHYKSLYTAAKEVTQQYQQEYRTAHGKNIPKSHIAVIPSYEQFVDRNHDSVYIPALATKRQKDIAHAPHQDYDTNVYYLRKNSNNKATNQFKQDEIDRREAQLDKMVNNKYDPTRRKQRLEEQNRKYQAEIKMKKQQKKQRASKKHKSKVIHKKPKQDSNHINNKSKKSSSKKDETKQEKLKKRIKNNISVPNNNAHKKTSTTNINNKNSSKSKVVSKSKESTQTNKVPTKAKSKSASNSKESNKKELTTYNSANRQLGNIDYSSNKQPYVFTNDLSTLTQVLKSFYLLNKQPIIKFDSNNYFKVNSNKLTNIKNPQKLLRDGKLSIEQYVYVRENNYKRFANDLLKHEEDTLNDASDRHEHNMIRDSSYLLTQKIPLIFKRYQNDETVKKSALSYFKATYKNMLQQLIKQYHNSIKDIKHVEKLRMNTRIAQRTAKLKIEMNTKEQQLQQDIRTNTVKVYNDSRHRRNKAIAKTLRNTKESVQEALNENLNDHRTEIRYQAGKVGHMIFDMLYQRLQLNRKNWRVTASKIATLQTKRERVRTKLHEVALKEETTDAKGQHHQNKALQAEIKRLREYTTKVDKRSDNLQRKLSQSQTKTLSRIDKNTKLQEKFDALKEQSQEDGIKYKAQIRDTKRKLADLQKILKNHANSVNKFNNFTEREDTQKIQLQDKLAQTIAKLQNAQNLIQLYETNKAQKSNATQPTSLSTQQIMQSKIASYRAEDAQQRKSYKSSQANKVAQLASQHSNLASKATSAQQGSTASLQSEASIYGKQRDSIATQKQAVQQQAMPQTQASKKIEKLRKALKEAQLNHSRDTQSLKAQQRQTAQAEDTAKSNAEALKSLKSVRASEKSKASQTTSSMPVIGPDDIIETPSRGNREGIESLKNQDTITEMRSEMNSMMNTRTRKKHTLPWRR